MRKIRSFGQLAAFSAAVLTVLCGCSNRQTVEDPEPEAVEVMEDPWERVVVTGSVVNLRAGPGTSYAVLGQAMEGDTLNVMGVSMDWLKVYHQRVSIFAWIYEPLTESLGYPE